MTIYRSGSNPDCIEIHADLVAPMNLVEFARLFGCSVPEILRKLRSDENDFWRRQDATGAVDGSGNPIFDRVASDVTVLNADGAIQIKHLPKIAA